jgi:hypothetical protein
MATMSGSGKGINIIVGATYTDKQLKAAIRDLQRMDRTAKKAQGPINQLASGFRNQLTPNLALAGAAAAAFAVKFGVDAVKAAAAEEAAITRLSQALNNVGETTALEGVESFIDGMARATGVADDQLRPAMVTLVNATGDAAEAQRLMSLALDVSAGSGRDLSSVTMALSKAANGQTTALRRLGVPLSAAALKSGDLRTVTAELNDVFGGQAARAANTYEGRIKRLGVAFGELQESLGTGFLNGLQGSEEGTRSLTGAIESLEPAMEGLGAMVATQVNGLGDLVDIMGLLKSETGEADSGFVTFMQTIKTFNPSPLEWVSTLRRDLENTGVEFDTVADKHAGYQDAVVRTANASRDAVTYVDDLGNEITQSGDDAEDAAAKFDIFAAAINKTEQVVSFRQAIDDVGNAFKKTNTPVNIFGEKGEENFNLLKGLITETASYAEAQTTLAGRASVASQGLTTLADAFKNTKMDSGTRALLLEPFQALIDDLNEAGVDVSGLQAMLDSLKSKQIDITVNYEWPDGRPPGGWPREWYGAKGGMVPQFFARGGLSRGPDTVPAMLAPGEYVMRRSAVKQFGTDLFSQLNRGINPLAGMTPTGAGSASGFQIGTINVVSAPGERAETSLPRALRRAAFLAGVNG